MRDFPYKYLLISAVVLLLDQLSKYAVWHYMPFGVRPVWGDLFILTHVQNTAAAFSLSVGSPLFNRIFFTTVSIILIFIVFWFIKKADNVWERFSFALILGGAMGNTLDRIILGSVTDFLDFDFPDVIMERWPIFNLADSSIVCAVIILLVYTLFFANRKRM